MGKGQNRERGNKNTNSGRKSKASIKERKLKIVVYGGSQGSIILNDGFLNIIKKCINIYFKIILKMNLNTENNII